MHSTEPLHVPREGGHTIQIGGFGTTVKVASQLNSGAVSIVEHTLEPGLMGAVPHLHHNEDEVSHVLEGELTVQLGNEVVTARPGEIVVKPRGQFHAFWNAGTGTVRFLEVIAPGGFVHYFEELAAIITVDAPPDIGAIMALATRYRLEFDIGALQPLLEAHGLRLG